MAFQASIVIDHSPATVFAWLADLEKLPEWEPSLAEVERQSEGPIRAGAAYRCRRNQPARTETRMVVTEYEPPKRLLIESDWAGFIKPEFGYLLEPSGAGTRVTLSANPKLRGAGRLLAPMLSMLGKRLSVRYLTNLKHLIDDAERRGPVAA